MKKVIDAAELREHLDDILTDVARDRTTYILSRDGGPDVALVPYRELVRLNQLLEEDILRSFEETREPMRAFNSDIPDEEIAADVAAALDEVRRAR